MRRSLAFTTFVFCLLSAPAMAGTDEWTRAASGGGSEGDLRPGREAYITPSTTGATDELELRCGSIRVYRYIDADPMTFDIEETDGTSWEPIHSTSPIPTTNTGYAEPNPPSKIRLNVQTNAGDTVRVNCNP